MGLLGAWVKSLAATASLKGSRGWPAPVMPFVAAWQATLWELLVEDVCSRMGPSWGVDARHGGSMGDWWHGPTVMNGARRRRAATEQEGRMQQGCFARRMETLLYRVPAVVD
jgi:hypothetical protein